MAKETGSVVLCVVRENGSVVLAVVRDFGWLFIGFGLVIKQEKRPMTLFIERTKILQFLCYSQII